MADDLDAPAPDGGDAAPRPGPPALRTPHLADSTVWSKVRTRVRPDLTEWFNQVVRADLIATCDVVVLELLRSARDETAAGAQAETLALLRSCPIGPAQWHRAREVQRALTARGQHRGVPPADLLIAAAAEGAGLPLLHYDHDYDLIAGVTGQRAGWLLPSGTLP